MDITSVSPAVSGAADTVRRSDEALGQDDFLNLLITQLQAQDPLNPMDGAEFTAQLAQFNSLEQLMDVNRALGRLESAVSEGQQVRAVHLIGRDVRVDGGVAILAEGESVPLGLSLDRDAAGVYAAVYDAANRYVATVDGGAMPAGEGELRWDGTGDRGAAVPAGTYRFEVMAVDAAGEAVTATPFFRARVTGVVFRDGAPILQAGEMEIPLAAAGRVEDPDAGS